MNIFKIKYTWCEGEYQEKLLSKEVDKKQFEEDLREARDFAQSLIGNEIEEGDYLGKGYRVVSLPEFYEQIIWFLENKKNYVECFLDDSEYSVDEEVENKIIVEKMDRKTTKTNL